MVIMTLEEFTKRLKQRGKKAHVADDLAEQVAGFSDFLQEKRGTELHFAMPDDVTAFAEWIETGKKGMAGKMIRGVALYYEMTGNPNLAATAEQIRERSITRKPLALKKFRGIDDAVLQKLADAGVTNVEQMLKTGGTPVKRADLAQRSGVKESDILELVKLSDLARIHGVKAVRTRLFYDAGVDCIAALAKWEPEPLHAMLKKYVEASGFDGAAPFPEEVVCSIVAARELLKIVE